MPEVGTFQVERLTPALWAELEPLLERHWREIAIYHDIPLNPQRDLYQALDAAGMLRIYTLRGYGDFAGELIGYAAYTVARNPQYQELLQAESAALYVHIAFRTGDTAKHLLRFAHDALRADGVQAVGQSVTTANDFGPVLLRLGYHCISYGYSKRLDKE